MSMGGMDMTGFRMVVNAASMIMKPGMESWSANEFVFTLGMWTIMMIGMMVPSAAPIILLFARVGRQAAVDRKPFASTSWFAGGYLFIWTAFAAIATSAQWALDRAALLTPTMALANVFGGVVLIGPASINGQLSRIGASVTASPLLLSSSTMAVFLGNRQALSNSGCFTAPIARVVAGH
jgi:predicted metal-binding membrane protein